MKLDKKRDAYVVTGFTDMRKQINGLARIVQDLDIKGPFTGNYYLFLGKTRRVMKILYWDDSGFCLWYLCEASHKYHYAKFPIM